MATCRKRGKRTCVHLNKTKHRRGHAHLNEAWKRTCSFKQNKAWKRTCVHFNKTKHGRGHVHLNKTKHGRGHVHFNKTKHKTAVWPLTCDNYGYSIVIVTRKSVGVSTADMLCSWNCALWVVAPLPCLLGGSGEVVSLSPLAAVTSGAYFLHNGGWWQWICWLGIKHQVTYLLVCMFALV